MTYPSQLTAVLLNYDAATPIANALDGSFAYDFLDEGNGTGTGSIAVPLANAASSNVVRGRYVQFSTNGVECFTFKIEGNPQYTQIARGNKFEQVLVASGRGWGCTWDEPIVDHETLEAERLDPGWRVFSFASFYFPNAGSWQPAIEQYEYFDFDAAATRGRVLGIENTGVDPDDPADDELKLYVAPIGFPWPNAPKNGNGFDPTPTYSETYWITADGSSENDLGTHFGRATFELAGDQETFFAVTADNFVTLFIQGVPSIGENDDTQFWTGWKDETLVLQAGLYVIAAAWENIDNGLSNPGGLLFNAVATSVYPGDVETSLTLSLLNSDDSWDTFFVAAGGEWPGWTPGQILTQILDEAVARGALTQFVAGTWGDLIDSDGGDWDTIDPDTTTEFIPIFSVRVGTTMLTVLSMMHDQGWIDWHFQPDTLTLDVWAAGAHGASSGVDFEPTSGSTIGNIKSLIRGETKPYANALKVQWEKGSVWVTDAAEIASYGTRVEDMFSTDAATQAEAERLGRVELLTRTAGARVAVLMEIEPRTQSEAPYEGDYAMFDYVNIPDESFTPVEQQVLSIRCVGDNENKAQWTLEVNSRWRAPERRMEELLRQIGGKTIGSPTNHGVARE